VAQWKRKVLTINWLFAAFGNDFFAVKCETGHSNSCLCDDSKDSKGQ